MKLLKWKKGGLKNPLARARGLGAAKEGVHHWTMQRVTAISNLVLVIWFLCSLVQGVAVDYESLTAWLGNTVNAILTILLIISTFYHAYLGAQVVTEDYIHDEGMKIVKLLGQKLFFFGAAVACIFAVLKISFGL